MLPGIICSAVIIAVLIYFIDWSVLRDALKNCSIGLFLTLFAVQTISFFCRGMAWRVILENAPSRMNAFFTITEGYLLNLLPLRLGEIVSDEPGVYLEGQYGIRIETILLVTKICENGDGTFLGFEPLTFVPIDRNLIDPAYLTPQTLRVLNEYHRMTWEKISPFLSEEEQEWLREQTAPIAFPGGV